jgi:hypothetical protein
LLSYNVALATLEQRTGTILETHGLVFHEERFRAAGPLLLHKREYPAATPPAGMPDRYPGKNEPSENSFDLREPAPRQLNSTLRLLPPVAVDGPSLQLTPAGSTP